MDDTPEIACAGFSCHDTLAWNIPVRLFMTKGLVSLSYAFRNSDGYDRSLLGVLGIRFWREAPETANGPDLKAGKRGLELPTSCGAKFISHK